MAKRPETGPEGIHMSNKIQTVESLWEILPDLEKTSGESMDPRLRSWENLVRRCIEAGALAPMVPAKEAGDIRLIAAAPFLKRALDDLRVVWILVETGYSFQAGAVAAALFETALTAAVLAESSSLAKQTLNSKNRDIPWSAKDLCQLNTKREARLAEKRGEKQTPKEYEDGWNIAYLHYKWLCQIKHPTWQAAFHAAKSTAVGPSEFAVRPGPNNLPEDVQLKVRIVAVSLIKTLQAVKSFFLSVNGEEENAEYQAFEDKVNEVHFGVMELIKLEYGKEGPIRILDWGWLKTDFATLKFKYG